MGAGGLAVVVEELPFGPPQGWRVFTNEARVDSGTRLTHAKAFPPRRSCRLNVRPRDGPQLHQAEASLRVGNGDPAHVTHLERLAPIAFGVRDENGERRADLR